jgi:hypothetical protein
MVVEGVERCPGELLMERIHAPVFALRWGNTRAGGRRRRPDRLGALALVLATYRTGTDSYEDQYWFSSTTEDALDFAYDVLIGAITDRPRPDPETSTSERLTD